MIYKIIAILILLTITIIPIGIIAYFTFSYSWWIGFSLIAYLYLFKKFIQWIKSVDTSEVYTDHTDGTRATIGTKEKIVTVLRKS